MIKTHVRIGRLAQVALFVGVAAATLTVGIGSALAHGEEVHADPDRAEPEATVTISGEGFEAERDAQVMLEGVLGSIELGTAKTDAEGSFALKVNLPGDIVPGSYQLKAAFENDSAVADFTVLEGTTHADEASGGIEVVFSRSDAEVIVIGLILAALIAGGTVLVLAGTRRAP